MIARQWSETMLAAEYAAVLAVSRAVYQSIQRQTTHFIETEAGLVMIGSPMLETSRRAEPQNLKVLNEPRTKP